MKYVLITEKEEEINGFNVVTKKPELSESEYKKAEYLIVKDILKSLSAERQ